MDADAPFSEHEKRVLVKPGGGRLASAWIPVAFCVLVIAIESTRYFGADETSAPLRRLVEFFTGPLKGYRWWRIHHYIRKTGHFVGFGLLSLSWFRAFWMTYKPAWPTLNRRLIAHGLALLGTLLVATSDEVHQLFLPNRTGSSLGCTPGLQWSFVFTGHDVDLDVLAAITHLWKSISVGVICGSDLNSRDYAYPLLRLPWQSRNGGV